MAQQPIDGQNQSTDCWSYVILSADEMSDHPPSLSVTWGQHVASSSRFIGKNFF